MNDNDLLRALADDWREIDGYPGYEVSGAGQVRSWRHKEGRRKSPWILKACPNNRGYLSVTLHDTDSKPKTCYVHKLVAKVFIGESDEWILHKDGDKGNNDVSNLYYGDALQNYKDSIKHGTAEFGEDRYNSKLTQQCVKEIRDSDKSLDELAEQFGIHRSHVHNVKTGKRWKHI